MVQAGKSEEQKGRSVPKSGRQALFGSTAQTAVCPRRVEGLPSHLSSSKLRLTHRGTLAIAAVTSWLRGSVRKRTERRADAIPAQPRHAAHSRFSPARSPPDKLGSLHRCHPDDFGKNTSAGISDPICSKTYYTLWLGRDLHPPVV